MASIVFYEKPGCITNRRQKKLLRAAGLELEVRDLLSEPWTRATLRPYFGELPVAAWFNRSAPAIKSGELVPETLTADQALAAMLANPLLIRRPLIRLGPLVMAGFDVPRLNAWLPDELNLPVPPDGLDSCSVRKGSPHHCVPEAHS